MHNQVAKILGALPIDAGPQALRIDGNGRVGLSTYFKLSLHTRLQQHIGGKVSKDLALQELLDVAGCQGHEPHMLRVMRSFFIWRHTR